MPDLTVNGIRLSYESSGSGAPIILLHGLFSCHKGMQPLFDRLAAASSGRRRIVAYDLRGFGESEKPESYTFDDHIADLAAIIEELDSGPVEVVGFSMGTMVTLALAARRPELVSRIVLLAPRARSLSDIHAVDKDSQSNVELQKYINDDRHLFAFPPSAELLGKVRRNRCRPLRFAQRNAALQAMVGVDLRPELPSIRQPALICVAEYDRINVPEEGRAIAAAIPGARCETISDAGHMLLFEQEDVVTGYVVEFLGLN